MSRPLRIEFAGALYHITCRGNARQPIFLDDVDRSRFLEQLGEVVARSRWECHAYCLMTNHYHLLLETGEPNLSKGMRQLNGTYAQWFNARHERVGHLLQGRFGGIVVERESHWLEVARYVVLNPVRAGMVRSPEHYLWSSLPATVGLAPGPAWFDPSPLVREFGSPSRYLEFVRQGTSGGSPLTGRRGVLLGSEQFADRMTERFEKKAASSEYPHEQRLTSRPPLDEVLPRSARSTRADRNARIRELTQEGRFSVAEISRFLDLHYSTVSRIAKTARTASANVQRQDSALDG
jgi:putative transposase